MSILDFVMRASSIGLPVRFACVVGVVCVHGAVCVGVSGCGSSSADPTPSPPAATVEGDFDPVPVGGARPAKVYVPGKYKVGTPMPLVVMLHGFGASGQIEEGIFGLTPYADSRGFLYVHPDGTPNKKSSSRFWNATNACCDGEKSGVDDSAYITSLIDEIATRFTVDPKRIFVTGHSNGGFMSYRMACDHSDKIAAVAVLAGAMWQDLASCKPQAPVAVLHVHGDKDDSVLYTGSSIAGDVYPSAKTSVEDWATFDGCGLTPDTSAPNLDVDRDIPGAETLVSRYGNCKSGTAVELWTIQGGAHVPALGATFSQGVVDFFFAHPKP